MKSILNILLVVLVYFSFQACGSIPQQTISHIGDSGDSFGSVTADIPFDQQSELTSPFGFTQSEKELESAQESNFDQQNEVDNGIIFMPVSIQNEFIITNRMLRFCETLYKSPCTHLRVQAGQSY